MRRIEVHETGPRRMRLDDDEVRLLVASELVRANQVPYQPGWWDVGARKQVGAARLGGLELWIEPKLPVARLLFLLGYVRRPKGWRDETVLLDTREGLVPAVAQALWRQAERALAGGLLQGYRSVEETSLVLRGRLREADQLNRHHGLPIPMEIVHDEFTVDVAENQILLGAVTRMLTVPRVDDASRRRLQRLRERLAGVTPPRPGGELPAWQPNRLNQRYHTALRLAEVVWAATAPEHVPGAVAANGFMFDMSKVFEEFVIVAIAERFAETGSGVVADRYQCHLDEALAVDMEPDLVCSRDGRPVAVLDAKYKAEKKSGYPNADLYQVLAYCTALDVRRGHLVYAKGSGEPARYVVRNAGVEIVCHALDLTLQPAPLLEQVHRIADELSADEPSADERARH